MKGRALKVKLLFGTNSDLLLRVSRETDLSASLSVVYALKQTLFKNFLKNSVGYMLREVRLETPQDVCWFSVWDPAGSYKIPVEINNK